MGMALQVNSRRRCSVNGPFHPLNSPSVSCGSRRGFTLVEVLLSTAVVSLLLGLMMTGVQAAREAARRLQCQHRLGQLALAVHNYHDRAGHLPISIGPWQDGPRPAQERNGISWLVGVLPHIERPALYDALSPGFEGDFFLGQGIRSPQVWKALQTSVPEFACPTDPSSNSLTRDHPELRGIWIRTTSFKGVLGETQVGGVQSKFKGSLPDCHAVGGCRGLFFRVSYQRPLKFADVTDGTSSTFLIGEDVPEHNARSGAFYANGDHGSCHVPPNYFPKPATPEHWPDMTSFRSRHRGGLHFALVDGAVRFVSQQIDHVEYQARSTRDGMEVIGNGSL